MNAHAGSSVGLTVNSLKFKTNSPAITDASGTGFGINYRFAFSGKHGFHIGYAKEGAKKSGPVSYQIAANTTRSATSTFEYGNTTELLYFWKFGNPDGMRPYVMGGLSRTGFDGKLTGVTEKVGDATPTDKSVAPIDDTFVGTTFVVGLEFPFGENLSGEVAYRSTNYGSLSLENLGLETKAKGFQLGLNWNF